MSSVVDMSKPEGVCPLCASEPNLLSGLAGGFMYSCSRCDFTPEGLQEDIPEAVSVWDQYSAPSFKGAKLNIVGWSWIAPDQPGCVITNRIDEARAAISAGHRVIPVYAADKEGVHGGD